MPFDTTPEEPKIEYPTHIRILEHAYKNIKDVKNWCINRANHYAHHSVPKCAVGHICSASWQLGGNTSSSYNEEDKALDALDRFARRDIKKHEIVHKDGIDRGDSRPTSRIATHNNLLGHAATVKMFEDAIAFEKQLFHSNVKAAA